MYIAHVDGEFGEPERALYKATLSRMSFEPHTKEKFDYLIKHEHDLIEAISKIDDPLAGETLLELLILMAVSDGELVEAERSFLQKVAQTFQVELDFAAIEKRAQEYRIDYSDSKWRKVAEATGNALGSAKDATFQLFQTPAEKAKGGFNKLFSRKPS
jgi:uncharacterized tellurite resistance protein B-like protein